MKFDIVKKIILDSIPENVNVFSIDFKEGSDNLTIKINWEVFIASEPFDTKTPIYNYYQFDGYAGHANFAYISDFKHKNIESALSESYLNQVKSELTDEVIEFKRLQNKKLLQQTGEYVTLKRNIYYNDKLIKQIDSTILVRFISSSDGWMEDYPTINDGDLLISTKNKNITYTITKVIQENNIQRFKFIKLENYKKLDQTDSQILNSDKKMKDMFVRSGLDAAKIGSIFNEKVPIEQKKATLNGKKISTLFDETVAPYVGIINNILGDCKTTTKATENTKQKPSGSFRRAVVADGYEAKPIDELAKEQKNKQEELYKESKKSYEKNVEDYNYSARKAKEDFEVACYIYQKQFGGDVVKSPMGNCSVVIDGNKVSEIDITYFANKFLQDMKCKIDKIVEEKEKKKNEPKPIKSRFSRILNNIKQIKDIILHG